MAASEKATVVAAPSGLKAVATPNKCSPGWPMATRAAMPPYTSVFSTITATSGSASSQRSAPAAKQEDLDGAARGDDRAVDDADGHGGQERAHSGRPGHDGEDEAIDRADAPQRCEQCAGIAAAVRASGLSHPSCPAPSRAADQRHASLGWRTPERQPRSSYDDSRAGAASTVAAATPRGSRSAHRSGGPGTRGEARRGRASAAHGRVGRSPGR